VSHATAIDEGNTAKFWTVVAGGALAAAGVAVGATYTLKSNHDATRADGLLRKIQSESDPTLVARGGECAITPAPTECAEFTSARSDSHQERNVAIGSFIAGGTFALATVGALVFWPESKPASAAGRVTLSPSGNWRAPAIILQGTF
jgi:hypothetical protein